MEIFIRRISNQDVVKQINIKKETSEIFFEGKESWPIIGETSKESGRMTILPSTDYRLGEDIKKIIKSEGEMKIDDLLVFRKVTNTIIVNLVGKSSREHSEWLSLFNAQDINQVDRHNNIRIEYNSQRNTNLLDIPFQKIINGAPGTGKSYLINLIAQEYFCDTYNRVTFHSNYTYGDFVGCYKPYIKMEINSDGDTKEVLTYSYVEGPFVKTLVEASKNPDKNYLLIVEEINRGNTSAIFGDIFQLLDRADNGMSEYPIYASRELSDFLKQSFKEDEITDGVKAAFGDNFETISLLPNIYLYASMNSSDQGIHTLDAAFKRRWNYQYIGLDDAIKDSEQYKEILFKSDQYKEPISWYEFRDRINSLLIDLNVAEDKLVGPYFINKNVLESNDMYLIHETIKEKLLLYLYEDVTKNIRAKMFSRDIKTFNRLLEKFNEDAYSIFKE